MSGMGMVRLLYPSAPSAVRLVREALMPHPPRLLDRVRSALRARHYSRRTEEAYVAWIRRYIISHGKRHPAEMGAFLLHDWDPIGVADIAEAQDEYDSYVGKIYGMLLRHEPRHKVVDHLWWIVTENMGLAGNRQHTEAIADRLLNLRDELETSG